MLRFVSATIVVFFWLLAMLGDYFATQDNNQGSGKRTSLQVRTERTHCPHACLAAT